ncbi:MAG: hypothetical protein ABEK50_04805 [bacterium]
MLPINYASGDVDLQLQAIGGRSLSVDDLPDSFTNQELGGQPLVVEGTATSDSPIQGVAYSLDGGQSWSRASGGENWSITLPTNQPRDFNLRVLAWTENNKMGSPLSIGPVYYRVIESVIPQNYETGDVSVNVTTIAGRSASEMEFPYHLYSDDVSQDGLRIAGEASGAGSIEGVAYSLDGGKTWERADGGENWTFYLPAQSSQTYAPQVRAWTADGIIGEPKTLNKLDYINNSYTTVLRNQFQQTWNDFSNKNNNQYFESFTEDFEYIDSLTNRSLTLSGYENFVSDFYSGIRNLNVFFDINQVLAGESGGEVRFAIEWRGKDDEADRPFIIFGDQSVFKYRRLSNGEFKVISFEDFPLIMYVFNRRQLRIPDLDGIVIDTLRVVDKDVADIIAELSTPGLVTNTIEIGGHVDRGGIKRLPSSTFSTVESLPSLGSGYEDEVLIEEGRTYAMNIRNQFGDASTGLLRVLDLRSNFVEVRMISAKSPPGIPTDVYRQYRGINPYE